MVEGFVWMVTTRNIFGIRLEKLKKLGKKKVEDWKSIPLPPFDFHSELPEANMHPFFLHSNLFFTGGYTESESRDIDTEPDPPSSKMYQLSSFVADNNNTQLKITAAPDGLIPPPPTLVSDCFIANIAGEVYLLVHSEITAEKKQRGFWVLRSEQWHPLPQPPSLAEESDSQLHFRSARWWECFLFRDRLFLQVEDPQGTRKLFLYVFNPQGNAWEEVEDNVTDSFYLLDDHDLVFPSITVSSLPDIRNCSVMLAWWTENVPATDLVKVKIHALLVDKQDNFVHRHQSLKECSDAIQPFFDIATTSVDFVDLGSGIVCALLKGHVPIYRYGYPRVPVLCVIVFALAIAAEVAPEEQRFLCVVDVLVNRVYYMQPYIKDYMPEDLLSAFIFTPKEELTLKHTGGKELKLVSGTKPSKPIALERE